MPRPASNPHPRAPRTAGRRRARGLIALAALAGAAACVAGGFAGWNDTVEMHQDANTIGDVGFVLVDATGGGSNVTTTFGPFVPEDSGSRYVGVQSSSPSSLGGITLDAVVGEVTDTFGDPADVSELTNNITVSVSVCATGWSAAAASTCAAGWQVSAIDGVTLQSLVDAPAALDEALPASSSPVGVRLDFTVDAATPDTVMGATLGITWQFNASSRAGVSSK